MLTTVRLPECGTWGGKKKLCHRKPVSLRWWSDGSLLESNCIIGLQLKLNRVRPHIAGRSNHNASAVVTTTLTKEQHWISQYFYNTFRTKSENKHSGRSSWIICTTSGNDMMMEWFETGCHFWGVLEDFLSVLLARANAQNSKNTIQSVSLVTITIIFLLTEQEANEELTKQL